MVLGSVEMPREVSLPHKDSVLIVHFESGDQQPGPGHRGPSVHHNMNKNSQCFLQKFHSPLSLFYPGISKRSHL